MVNFDEREEARMEQEAFENSTIHEQVIYMSAAQFAKLGQYRALLMTLRSAINEQAYDVDRISRHIVVAFNELEGMGC